MGSNSSAQAAAYQAKIKFDLERSKANKKYETDFVAFASDNLKALSKSGEEVSFNLLPSQQVIFDAISAQLEDQGYVRAVITKGRQQGSSSLSSAWLLWHCLFRKNQKAIIIAQDNEMSETLFDYTKSFMNSLPADIRPVTDTKGARNMRFAKTNSQYKVFTSGSDGVGRGYSPRLALCSEVAHWKSGALGNIRAGALQGIPNEPGTAIIFESTAFGMNEFYDLWLEATTNPDSHMIGIFVPWFISPEYSEEVLEPIVYTTEELELIEKYKLTDGQLKWRRSKISELGGVRFRQEYPAYAEEAFIASGTGVFDIELLEELSVEASSYQDTWHKNRGDFVSDEDKKELFTWRTPSFNGEYVMGVDVSGGGGGDGDYSVATVMTPEGSVEAIFRSNVVDPATLAEVISVLGRRYNNCLIAVESNSIGMTTLNHLINVCKYPNVYYETKVSQASHEATLKPGIRVGANKDHLIANIKKRLVDKVLEVRSSQLFSELSTYVIKDGGKMEASGRNKDDCVMSLAMALEALRTHTGRLSVSTDWTSLRQGWKDDNTQWM